MKYLLLSAAVFCVIVRGIAFAEAAWTRITGIKEPDVKQIIAKDDLIYAATEKRLYRSEDHGKTWETVFFLRGTGGVINFTEVSGNAVFVCTDKGLFKSIDGKTGWKKIFRVTDEEGANVYYIAFKDKIYLGTGKGLFLSDDNGVSWHVNLGETGNISVKWISSSGENIFLATEKGVYRGTRHGFERVFVASARESEEYVDSDNEDVVMKDIVHNIIAHDEDIYIASETGVFISKDAGKSWFCMGTSGLDSRQVNRILFEKGLYVSTDRGVYMLDDKQGLWRVLYKGMGGDKINSISADNKGRIWAATDKGAYVLTDEDFSSGFPGDDEIFRLFAGELSIEDVQKAAIEYAEVSPGKIINWRKRAGIKALLPEFSLDYDKTITYDSGVDRYFIGPYDWGMNVKWDLGELIWNDDQTSIDVRSKLMVQLRGDILDEVTRTYFERRRLIIESRLFPSDSVKGKMEKELRIKELTAGLDAMTNGRFSESINP
jgi:hypothetical protein